VQRWAATVDRPLPWRGERDPYKVLVSEVMLQQTQASRVAPSYAGFLERFPTVEALARADTADVLREWGALGYNRRALNLLRATREIVARGGFPSGVEELVRLPGVGPYTARAIASFAFDADVGVVDANVGRVIARVYGIDGSRQEIADRLVPSGRGAAWNQTMIDLGALVCRARTPSCDVCPLRASCAWVKTRRPPSKRRSPARPFKTTSRYVRGRIVAELRASDQPVGIITLRRRIGVEAARFDSALTALERDSLVRRAGRRVALGARDSSGLALAARRRPRRGSAFRRG
jgi:A/G-specific adenine glycosylase